jgi:hypothetical protein
MRPFSTLLKAFSIFHNTPNQSTLDKWSWTFVHLISSVKFPKNPFYLPSAHLSFFNLESRHFLRESKYFPARRTLQYLFTNSKNQAHTKVQILSNPFCFSNGHCIWKRTHFYSLYALPPSSLSHLFTYEISFYLFQKRIYGGLIYKI